MRSRASVDKQEDRVEADGPPVEQHVGDAVDRIGLVRKGRAEQLAGLGEARPVDVGRQLEEPAEADHSVSLSFTLRARRPVHSQRQSYP